MTNNSFEYYKELPIEKRLQETQKRCEGCVHNKSPDMYEEYCMGCINFQSNWGVENRHTRQ